MHTKEAALADPVIGKYVAMILSRGDPQRLTGWGIRRTYGQEVHTLIHDAEVDACSDAMVQSCAEHPGWVSGHTETLLAECALAYLLTYPDTACMLDLSRDTLLTMAKMGSVPAALYMLLVEE